jgi:hypothetical protein
VSIFNISLDAANKIYNIGWYISILNAGLTFFSIATVFWSDSIRDSYTERAIASATATAEQAKEGAAKSNERAAALEVKAEQARLAQRQIESTNLIIQRDLERERAERLRLETLVNKIRPREIPKDHIQELAEDIANLPQGVVAVTSEITCSDCSAYGAEFENIFRQAGWQVHTASISGPGESTPKGLFLRLGANSKIGDGLISALSNAGIPFDVSQSKLGASTWDTGTDVEVIILAISPG